MSRAAAAVIVLALVAWLIDHRGFARGAARVTAQWDAARALHAEQLTKTLGEARAREIAHATKVQSAQRRAAQAERAMDAERADALRELDRLRSARAASAGGADSAEDRTAAGAGDAAATRAGLLHEACEGALLDLARDADRLSANLALLQAWSASAQVACSPGDGP